MGIVTPEVDHEHWRGLLAMEAVGQLDDGDREDLRAHVEGCPAMPDRPARALPGGRRPGPGRRIRRWEILSSPPLRPWRSLVLRPSTPKCSRCSRKWTTGLVVDILPGPRPPLPPRSSPSSGHSDCSTRSGRLPNGGPPRPGWQLWHRPARSRALGDIDPAVGPWGTGQPGVDRLDADGVRGSVGGGDLSLEGGRGDARDTGLCVARPSRSAASR